MELKKINLPKQYFQKKDQILLKPEVTKRPKVTPKIYKEINKKIKGIPILKIETPKKGIANKSSWN